MIMIDLGGRVLLVNIQLKLFLSQGTLIKASLHNVTFPPFFIEDEIGHHLH